jgi:hypothetical protein
MAVLALHAAAGVESKQGLEHRIQQYDATHKSTDANAKLLRTYEQLAAISKLEHQGRSKIDRAINILKMLRVPVAPKWWESLPTKISAIAAKRLIAAVSICRGGHLTECCRSHQS